MLSSSISTRLCQTLFSRAYSGINSSEKNIVLLTSVWNHESRRCYAKATVTGIAGLGKKKLGKAGPVIEKKKVPVETDPKLLVTHCCGLNYMKEGGHVKLKEDSEYPEWLFEMHLDGWPPMETLDPDTDEYWDRIKMSYKGRMGGLAKLKRIK